MKKIFIYSLISVVVILLACTLYVILNQSKPLPAPPTPLTEAQKLDVLNKLAQNNASSSQMTQIQKETQMKKMLNSAPKTTLTVEEKTKILEKLNQNNN